MWKLIIHQMKKFNTWESDQEIEYLDDDITNLTALIDHLSSMQAANRTWYELKRITESEEQV